MNAAHIHLILNTIPGIGIGLAIAAMLYGMARRSSEVVRFGVLVLIGVAVVTIAVYLSGKRAIDVVGNVPGVILPNIEVHERAGRNALIAVEIGGLIALAVLVRLRRAEEIGRGVIVALLVASVAAFAMVLHAAILGGHIHHPESGGNQAIIDLPKVEAPAR